MDNSNDESLSDEESLALDEDIAAVEIRSRTFRQKIQFHLLSFTVNHSHLCCTFVIA